MDEASLSSLGASACDDDPASAPSLVGDAEHDEESAQVSDDLVAQPLDEECERGDDTGSPVAVPVSISLARAQTTTAAPTTATRTVVVPASAVMAAAGSQPALLAAAALGIPVTFATAGGAIRHLTLTTAGAQAAATGGGGGGGGGAGGNFALVPVRRVLLQMGNGGQPTPTTVVALQPRMASGAGAAGQMGLQAGGGVLLQSGGSSGARVGEQLVVASAAGDTSSQSPLRFVIATSAISSAQATLAVEGGAEGDDEDQPGSAALHDSAEEAAADEAAAVAAAADALSAAATAAASNDPSDADEEDRDHSSSAHSVMIDASDARMFADHGCASYAMLASPTHHNGRMTPPSVATCYVTNSYATLTPLQPLPPISTISGMAGDKFQPAYSPGSQAVGAGGPFVMQGLPLGSPYSSYEKLAMSPTHYSSHVQGDPALSPHSSYSQNGPGVIHHVGHHAHHLQHAGKQEPLSPGAAAAYYDPSQRPSPHDLSPHSLEHSPGNSAYGGAHSTPLTSGNNPSLNGGLASVSPHTISPVPHHAHHGHHRDLSPPSPASHHHHHVVHLSHQSQAVLHAHLAQQQQAIASPVAAMVSLKASNNNNNNTSSSNSNANNNNNNNSSVEAEEINTKDLAQRISAELKRYSIPQAIFAQRVLCRSQGTLSDLLRNPKPWSKLKSGRETFRRMAKWLQEPEYKRMSELRLAGESHIFNRTSDNSSRFMIFRVVIQIRFHSSPI
jgi:hypothetical protein